MSKGWRPTSQAPVKHIWYQRCAHFQGWQEEGDSCCPTTYAQEETQHSPESLRTIDIQVRPKQNPSKIMSLTDTENQMPSMYGKSIGGSGAVTKENTEITVMLQI